MCLDPLSATTIAALQIGGSFAAAGLGLAQQVVTANATNAYYEENAKAARAAEADRFAHLQNRMLQERAAATQQLTENAIKGLEARATARVGAGEAGVSGLSVDALLDDYYGREGRRADSIKNNYEMSHDYLLGELNATEHQAQARINQARRAEVGVLDVLGAAVKAGTGTLGAMRDYNRMTARGGGVDNYAYGLGIG